MTIKVGEKGQPFRIATGYDMSSSTALSIKFTKPDATTFTVTNLTTPAVSAPAVALTNDPELGSVAASTYFEYTTDGTEFDIAGTNWTACGVFTTAALVLEANEVTFTIGASCV
tara:strand:- start:2212 stop:2553 length:342 start_codon:yes stop_codon:yes gene_type:complete